MTEILENAIPKSAAHHGGNHAVVTNEMTGPHVEYYIKKQRCHDGNVSHTVMSILREICGRVRAVLYEW